MMNRDLRAYDNMRLGKKLGCQAKKYEALAYKALAEHRIKKGGIEHYGEIVTLCKIALSKANEASVFAQGLVEKFKEKD